MASPLLQQHPPSSAEEAAPAPAPPPANPEPAAAPAPAPGNSVSSPRPEPQGAAAPVAAADPDHPHPHPHGRALHKACGKYAGWAFAGIAALALLCISVMPELLLGGRHSASASAGVGGKKGGRGSSVAHTGVHHMTHRASSMQAKAREQRRFDCRGGSPEAWPQAEQKWCCDHAPELQLGNQTQLWCLTQHANDQQPKGLGSSSSARFDCMEDLWTWKESWKPEKKRWCCREKLMFCPPSAQRTAPTISTAASAATAATTSTAATTTAAPTTTTAAPTTTTAAPTTTTAAPTTTTAAPTTTTAAPTTTTAAPTTTTAAPTTTTAAPTTMAPRITAAPAVFAPSTTQASGAYPAAQPGAASSPPTPSSVVGPPSTLSGDMYDCGEYDSTWQRDWTAAKKSWCCRSVNRGCQPCEFGCQWRGVRSTCQAHIQRAANLQGGCKAAHTQVVQACSLCGQCQVHAACGGPGSAGQDAVLTQSLDVTGATVNDVQQGESVLVQGIANALHLQTANVHVAKLSDDQGITRVMYQVTVPQSQLQEVQKRAGGLFYTASPGGRVQGGTFGLADPVDGMSEGAGQQYACDAAQELVWSEAERNWCCNVRPGGCQAPTTAAPFDCLNGMAAPSSWPEVKKDWCCQHYVVGCSAQAPAPAPPRYTEEYSRAQSKCLVSDMSMWPQAMRQWCCDHAKLGCDHARKYEVSARLAPGTFLGPATRLRVRPMLALAGAALGTALLALVLVLLGLRAMKHRRDQRRRDQRRLIACGGDEHHLLEREDDILL